MSVHSAHPHWFAELADAWGIGRFQRVVTVEFYDQAVTARSFESLATLRHLKQVTVMRGRVSTLAVKNFRQRRPDVKVDVDPCAFPLTPDS